MAIAIAKEDRKSAVEFDLPMFQVSVDFRHLSDKTKVKLMDSGISIGKSEASGACSIKVAKLLLRAMREAGRKMKCPKCGGKTTETFDTDYSDPDNSVEVKSICDRDKNDDCNWSAYAFVKIANMVED